MGPTAFAARFTYECAVALFTDVRGGALETALG
jgi:hypothetical protein